MNAQRAIRRRRHTPGRCDCDKRTMTLCCLKYALRDLSLISLDRYASLLVGSWRQAIRSFACFAASRPANGRHQLPSNYTQETAHVRFRPRRAASHRQGNDICAIALPATLCPEDVVIDADGLYLRHIRSDNSAMTMDRLLRQFPCELRVGDRIGSDSCTANQRIPPTGATDMQTSCLWLTTPGSNIVAHWRSVCAPSSSYTFAPTGYGLTVNAKLQNALVTGMASPDRIHDGHLRWRFAPALRGSLHNIASNR